MIAARQRCSTSWRVSGVITAGSASDGDVTTGLFGPRAEGCPSVADELPPPTRTLVAGARRGRIARGGAGSTMADGAGAAVGGEVADGRGENRLRLGCCRTPPRCGWNDVAGSRPGIVSWRAASLASTVRNCARRDGDMVLVRQGNYARFGIQAKSPVVAGEGTVQLNRARHWSASISATSRRRSRWSCAASPCRPLRARRSPSRTARVRSPSRPRGWL